MSLIDEPIIGYPNALAMLEALYVKEGLTINEIALRTGISLTTMLKWAHELGIPVRKRGGANNAAVYTRHLHLLDPRVVMDTSTRDLEKLTGIKYSNIYKYKREVKALWNSALSVPQQG